MLVPAEVKQAGPHLGRRDIILDLVHNRDYAHVGARDIGQDLIAFSLGDNKCRVGRPEEGEFDLPQRSCFGTELRRDRYHFRHRPPRLAQPVEVDGVVDDVRRQSIFCKRVVSDRR